MPSTLEVRDNRRSRSKSPGGRDRSRSRSRDTRETDTRRSNRKYSETDSEESEDDYRRREKKSSKKSYESDSAEDKRRRKKSSSKYEDESEESDRHRSSRSSKDNKTRRRDRSASDDDRRKEKGRKDKSSKKKSEESESSESDDISISIHRKSKSKHENEKSNGQHQAFPPSAPYGYPPQPQGYGYPQQPQGYHDTRHMSYVGQDPRYGPPGAYVPHPPAPEPQRAGSFSAPNVTKYAEMQKYEYARPDANISYKYNDDKNSNKQYIKTYNAQGQPQLVEVKPEHERRRDDKKYADDKYDRPHRKYSEDKYEKPERKYSEDRYDRVERKYPEERDEKREKNRYDDKYRSSTDEVSKKLSHLAIGGALGAATLGVVGHGSPHGGRPPASPLLEAYKGTYQSISPMPSALVLAGHKNDSDLSDLDLESDSDYDRHDPNADLKRKIRQLEKEKAKFEVERTRDEKHGHDRHNDSHDRSSRSRQNSNVEIREPKHRDRADSDASSMIVISPTSRKKVKFYDPTDDAKKIAAALEGTHRAPNVKPLIQILPGLSTDDLIALRAEYKNFAKVGGQGINIAKHIKMRIPGNLGKAVYATALGRWESEAYWANSWYQGGASRRELLIESLMGRSNSDIREIKNCFKDKRYNDDLEKCMKAELKADKFRTAILLALEERRMTEGIGLDIQLIRQDVQELHRALTSSGGESAMIQIIVVRSDTHLREVLRIFERTYHVNFAREMISKSRNLVGETLAHVLNGALNRPMRDALLLHQAISETAPGKERAELLISRLVRLHWEPKHLERVKAQYEHRYDVSVELAIRKDVISHMKTEEGKNWAEFCVELVRSSA